MYETVIASKVSGDSNGISFNSAMDVDFNLYNNTVNINNEIISPISDYAFNYYKYKLEGDFYDTHGNLINKIKIIPKEKMTEYFLAVSTLSKKVGLFMELIFKLVEHKHKFYLLKI